jgi:ABC-type proline/glycine betaine transport system ATPase subunit
MIERTISFSIHGLSVVGKSVLVRRSPRLANIHNIWIHTDLLISDTRYQYHTTENIHLRTPVTPLQSMGFHISPR